MKQKHRIFSRFQLIPKDELASLKGGGEDKIIYINGKPYVIETKKDGSTMLIPVNL
ncbi:hypothetical protein SAMN05216331_11465 [Porphyromonadaceae bacterium KH3R12]|uniref:hypothetical protein n=1 Tax=Proteiniphilum saccharofermentans TaxID=1642647 RepID=UPI0008997F0D|nr:hypothetical protein [Proteiniphilum saccharofermentans]SEA01145.1 hypothetical protein SAMN05216331_11465 [Porphyromonadaceae bacterium KH3R12]